MGRKGKKENRVQGNLKPADSSRVADLTVSFASFDSNFTGNHLFESVDPELSVILKKISKRDSGTRLKAVDELCEYYMAADDEKVEAMIPYWVKQYVKLSLDVDRRVREATSRLFSRILETRKKSFGPYLKEIVPCWICSRFDTSREASAYATESFQKSFPNKSNQVLTMCIESCIEWWKENLFHQTADTMSDPRFFSTEDRTSKYERVISGCLLSIALYVDSLHAQVYEPFTPLIESGAVLSLVSSESVLIAKGARALLRSLCVGLPVVVERKLPLIVDKFLENSLKRPLKNQSHDWIDVFDTIALLTKTIPDCWLQHKDFTWTKFLNFIKQDAVSLGCFQVVNYTLTLLAYLPPKLTLDPTVLTDTMETLLYFIENLPMATRIESVVQCYYECLVFIMVNPARFAQFESLSYFVKPIPTLLRVFDKNWQSILVKFLETLALNPVFSDISLVVELLLKCLSSVVIDETAIDSHSNALCLLKLVSESLKKESLCNQGSLVFESINQTLGTFLVTIKYALILLDCTSTLYQDALNAIKASIHKLSLEPNKIEQRQVFIMYFTVLEQQDLNQEWTWLVQCCLEHEYVSMDDLLEIILNCPCLTLQDERLDEYFWEISETFLFGESVSDSSLMAEIVKFLHIFTLKQPKSVLDEESGRESGTDADQVAQVSSIQPHPTQVLPNAKSQEFMMMLAGYVSEHAVACEQSLDTLPIDHALVLIKSLLKTPTFKGNLFFIAANRQAIGLILGDVASLALSKTFESSRVICNEIIDEIIQIQLPNQLAHHVYQSFSDKICSRILHSDQNFKENDFGLCFEMRKIDLFKQIFDSKLFSVDFWLENFDLNWSQVLESCFNEPKLLVICTEDSFRESLQCDASIDFGLERCVDVVALILSQDLTKEKDSTDQNKHSIEQDKLWIIYQLVRAHLVYPSLNLSFLIDSLAKCVTSETEEWNQLEWHKLFIDFVQSPVAYSQSISDVSGSVPPISHEYSTVSQHPLVKLLVFWHQNFKTDVMYNIVSMYVFDLVFKRIPPTLLAHLYHKKLLLNVTHDISLCLLSSYVPYTTSFTFLLNLYHKLIHELPKQFLNTTAALTLYSVIAKMSEFNDKTDTQSLEELILLVLHEYRFNPRLEFIVFVLKWASATLLSEEIIHQVLSVAFEHESPIVYSLALRVMYLYHSKLQKLPMSFYKEYVYLKFLDGSYPRQSMADVTSLIHFAPEDLIFEESTKLMDQLMTNVTDSTNDINPLILLAQYSILYRLIQQFIQEESLFIEMNTGKEGFDQVLASKTLPSCISEAVFSGKNVKVLSYLVQWLLVLSYFENSTFALKQVYLSDIKSHNDAIIELFELLFQLLDLTEHKPFDASLWDVTHIDMSMIESVDDTVLKVIACHLYYKCLSTLPSLVRQWWMDCRNRQLTMSVEKFTENHFSPYLIALETNALLDKASAIDGMNIKYNQSTNEILAMYLVEESSLDVSIKIPSNYPLRQIQVSGGTFAGVSESRWRGWLLSTASLLTVQNASVKDALSLLKKNLDLHFEGVEDCAICYSVIGLDRSLPSKRCRTCKHLFHASCLFKWFKSSNQSTCPLCRSLF